MASKYQTLHASFRNHMMADCDRSAASIAPPEAFLLLLCHFPAPTPLTLKLWESSRILTGLFQGAYPQEEMVVPTGTLNALVPFSPLSCKELEVGFAIHPPLVKTTFHGLT